MTALALLLVFALVGGSPGVAEAQAQVTGAAISLNKTVVQPGQRVLVTLTGWKARSMTLSVCGNLARQGSVDCNLAGSQTEKLRPSPEPTQTELTVFAPPGTCPCVVRASSATQDEVTFAPIELVGIPVGPVVGPTLVTPVSVDMDAREAERGFVGSLRSALGGPTNYDVTVVVRNQSPETLDRVSVAGSVWRSGDDIVVSFDIPVPSEIAPGQVWRHQQPVVVPAPVLSRLSWRVIASGAGEPVTAQTVTRHFPVAFWILVVLLSVDVAAMACYFTFRRRRFSRASEEEPTEVLPAVLLPGPKTIAT